MKLPSLVASRWRPALLFKLLQALHSAPGFSLLAKVYDPNSIRNKIAIQFPEKFAMLERENFRLEVNLNDHVGYWTYIRKTPFEQSVYFLARSLDLGEKDAILDIGANIGLASVPICAETGCELIAVEASKLNASLLLRNAAMNDVRIQLHAVALTSPEDAGGYIPFFINNGNLGANSLFAQWAPSLSPSRPERVPARTLDDLNLDDATLKRIRIVKIDVEGAELQLLNGAREFLRRNRAPILMEYRLDAVEKYLGSDLSELITLMRNDYEVFGFDGKRGEQPFFDGESYENILFRRRPN